MGWKTTAAFLLLFSLALPVDGFAAVDDDAEIILVRKDCGTQDNCFETIASALGWTWNTREPSAASPLLWDVGPGTWNEQWSCTNDGFVTVRGAGREQTILATDNIWGAVSVNNCEQLEFLDIGIHGSLAAVYWVGPGTSTWTDTDVIGTEGGSESIAWADEVCVGAQTERAVHYFFGSRIIQRDVTRGAYPATAWYGNCSDTWFYGGEIALEWSENASGFPIILDLHKNTRFQVFGTALRGFVTPAATSTSGAIIGVSLSGDPAADATMFHMHGGIISLLTNPAHSVSVIGVAASGNALAHTPGTAFNLRAGSGAAVTARILSSGGGKVDSPFLWQAGTTPPAASGESNVLTSADGEDMFVETDCAQNGDCDGAGSQAHLMLYNPAQCGSTEPWFDVVTGRCRNDTGS